MTDASIETNPRAAERPTQNPPQLVPLQPVAPQAVSPQAVSSQTVSPRQPPQRADRSAAGPTRPPQRQRVTAATQNATHTIDPFRAQHLALSRRDVQTETGRTTVTVDDAESPLTWLARRKGRDGVAMIDAVQLEAGERLRADFTRGHLMPRTTSNWSVAVASGARGSGGGVAAMTDAIVASRQRVRHAVEAVGPEFSGVLLDVCCFLKGMEDVERERRWPARSAKVVLQLALDALARHYGIRQQLRGAPRPALRTWLAEDAAFVVDG